MIWEKGERDGFRNEFYYMILLKEKNYFKYRYFKNGVFKPYSSIYYLTQ